MVLLKSTQRMSNSGYHRSGKPNWWARVGTGSEAKFLPIPRVRGDEYLTAEVDLPEGTEVFIGAGKGKDSVRETIVIANASEES